DQFPTVSDEQTCQRRSSCDQIGSCVPICGKLIMRILENLAAARSRSGSVETFTDHCMFDWPEQIQTSPTSTSSSLSSFLPLIFSVCGPPTAIGSSVTCHLPSAPAVTFCVCLSMDTLTTSPGSAVPQTLFGFPCCSTMWLLKMLGTLTSAAAGWACIAAASAA